MLDNILKDQTGEREKERFKIFDFFANYEYFEEKYNYDEVIELPRIGEGAEGPEPTPPPTGHESARTDFLVISEETAIGFEGMKIDRMYFEKFEEKVKNDPVVTGKIEKGEWEDVLAHIEKHHFDKPEEFFNLEKLRKAVHVDRRLSLREIVEKIFGFISYFKSKNELLDDEFDKFDTRYMPSEELFNHAKNVFKSYVLDPEFRQIVDNRNYALMNIYPNGEAFKKLTPELRKIILEYIKDYVPLNKFVA